MVKVTKSECQGEGGERKNDTKQNIVSQREKEDGVTIACGTCPPHDTGDQCVEVREETTSGRLTQIVLGFWRGGLPAL